MKKTLFLILLFTKKEKILQQDTKNIFCNSKGAMIADGLIWFNKLENEKKLLIIAINK